LLRFIKLAVRAAGKYAFSAVSIIYQSHIPQSHLRHPSEKSGMCFDG
jgi:hypothetical protein